MSKVKKLLEALSSEILDEYEMHFDHKGKKAIAFFHVLDMGQKPLRGSPGPYSTDPYAHQGELPELRFVAAHYEDSDEEIKDLTEEEIAALEEKAAENYADQMEND